jgi:hypothetical protein
MIRSACFSFGDLTVLGVGELAQICHQTVATELLMQEDVDRVGDGIFPEVEHGRVVYAVLVDVVA